MDPVSQAVVGASVAQSASPKRKSQALAFVAGALSGMAADLDILIRSETDPLLFLEYHRQFTHSFVFIPLGALLCTLLLYPFLKRKSSFINLFIFCCLGYATHGLLDACTSYGTQLFWPFSDARIAWDIISVVDPLLTLPVLSLSLIALFAGKRRFARAALIYFSAYLMLGLMQRHRALDAITHLVASRGHETERVTVKPTFGNLLVWKLIYEYNGRYYVDAVRLGLSKRHIPGESVPKLDASLISKASPVQARDIRRFSWFSNEYLALSPNDDNVIVDVRYSMIPNRIEPLWGIRLKPEQPERHVDYVVMRKFTPETRQQLLAMLLEQPIE